MINSCVLVFLESSAFLGTFLSKITQELQGIGKTKPFYRRPFWSATLTPPPWRILGLPASGRCLRATPAAPPAPVCSTPQQRAARCGAAFRGLDRRRKMGEPGTSGVCWGSSLATAGFRKAEGGTTSRVARSSRRRRSSRPPTSTSQPPRSTRIAGGSAAPRTAST
jgi:hypothetical protein